VHGTSGCLRALAQQANLAIAPSLFERARRCVGPADVSILRS